jgi:ribosomal-protein-alanine N-acetyltransferase
VKYVVESMTHDDIAEVLAVDRESYALPWPASAYRRELSSNQHAHYIVLKRVDGAGVPVNEQQPATRHWKQLMPWLRTSDSPHSKRVGHVIGYAGMWLVGEEAHVTTVAVAPEARGKGFGELLLASLIEIADELQARWVTLEVRVSNFTAQQLYRKYGFREAGLRKRYYSDNNEDALIMTTDDVSLEPYRSDFAKLRDTLVARLRGQDSIEARAPVLSTSRFT